MELLKLVLVDDETILLKGLEKTYDWNKRGFEIVGTAQSGEQAIEVIEKTKPHVVLTDIRMKKITGLMVMETIKEKYPDIIFIVLSAYRDFDYAKKAVDLGAFGYLLKPLEEDKLWETMENAYKACMKKIKSDEKYESWEKLVEGNSSSFLSVVLEKYITNNLKEEKAKEVFKIVEGNVENKVFASLCVDVDISYKITNSLDVEASRFNLNKKLEEIIGKEYMFWHFDNINDCLVYLIQGDNYSISAQIKALIETVGKNGNIPIVSSISKGYTAISGMKKSYNEAVKLFELAKVSGACALTTENEIEPNISIAYPVETEALILSAIRKNSLDSLKEAMVAFIYSLPKEEEVQISYLHKLMLKVDFMLKDTYGYEENIKQAFKNYYANLQELKPERAVDICYKILIEAIKIREGISETKDIGYFTTYIDKAVSYIDEHLNDENLSIVSVATYVFLNPVYFGRVFKNTFKTTFKKYLLEKRMERAKTLLLEGNESIGTICEMVGIPNPSYFSHLFKQYTGMLPSEYKKEND